MKYIVTSVQLGAIVNKNMLENMLAFAKHHKVDTIYAFVQKGKYKDEEKIDPRILEHCELIFNNITLNSNLRLFDSKILPQQINPLTGMAQKLSRDYSHILPSPKIRYKSLASINTHPRVIMTTGSLTHGNYKNHTAHGKKAEEQHQYGFVYVEVKNNVKFSTLQMEVKKNGTFHHLTDYYSSGRKMSARPEVLIMGDWHTGHTNKKSRRATITHLEDLHPRRAVFHDLFDGQSINPHEKGDLISELRNYKEKRLNLVEELKMVYKEIMFFSKKFPDITFIVSESNHDIFLERYIRSKGFIQNPENFLFVCDMINEVVEDKKPTLEIALSRIGKLPSNFIFLKENQEYRVRGWEIGYHGHRGANGSRGSSGQFSRLNLRMVSGHEHTPEVHANGIVVGTNTELRLPYTKGASSWMHANAIIYRNGTAMLIPIIN